MNDYQMLDHEKIKVGDTVGVLQKITVGWGRREYRHSYAKKDIIVRITPKRTKFFGSSGQEYSNHTVFVALDEYALMENEYALRFKRACSYMVKLNQISTDTLALVSDETMEVLAESLSDVLSILEDVHTK